MRGLLLVISVTAPLLWLPAAAPAGVTPAIAGTWTWDYPHGGVAGESPSSFPSTRQTEAGSLAIGPAAGQWTVELPSAIVGCKGGRPLYAPKASGTPIVETTPNGSCRLYAYEDGRYLTLWRAEDAAGPVHLGPMRGQGSFK